MALLGNVNVMEIWSISKCKKIMINNAIMFQVESKINVMENQHWKK